jgi:hypothetical protein
VNPAENVLAVAIEEILPQGFSAANISAEGVWDSRNEKIKWGPYFDNQSRILTYNLTPPVGYAGSVDLIGFASLDGVDIPTEGDTSVDFESVPEASVGERTIHASPDGVNISLFIKPTNGTVVYAVEESLPTGLSASSISGGGILDAVNNKIKWGPFFDSNPRTLTYALVTPDGFSGAVTFSGFTSIDGRDVAVGGERSIEIDSPTKTGPMIVTQPVGGEVVLGESFALSVAVEGSVQGYQWFKDNQALPGANLPFLILPAVGSSDFGAYQVMVSGPDGTVESEIVVLSQWIEAPSGPMIDPTSISFLEIGNTQNMTLTITSEPSKKYQVMMRQGLTEGSWQSIGPQQIASKDSLTFLLDVTGRDAAFFIVTVVE